MDIFKGNSQDNELFVKDCWYVAAWDYEIKQDELFSITIANQALVLYRKENGELVALIDQCCHRLAPLSKGRIEGEDLRCMYHGLKFNPQGKCIEIPGQDEIGEQYCVKTYPVIEKHSWVWIWLGDPEKADIDLIPPAVGLDIPKWTMKSGHLDYDACYLLINDNLTDLSHIAFTHANTFGGGSEMSARIPAKVSRLERGIRVIRWNPNQSPRPFVADESITNCDQYMQYDFLMPGVFLMYSAIYKEGTAEKYNLDIPDPDEDPLHADFTSQAVTGMTDITSRYFFSWGPRTLEHEINPDILEGMWAMASAAFLEDKVMIEAQQQNILAEPGAQTRSIIHDKGPTLMRRIMDKAITEEQAETEA